MFQSMSEKNGNCGSVWGWHGSPIGNWHDILRTGLKNMSNTKKMRNGAVFGKGIYLAPNSQTSYWYCEPERSDTWPLSMMNVPMNRTQAMSKGQGLYCLALCEILNHPKLKKPDPYYVVPSESWVITRYLFVFHTRDVRGSSRRQHYKGKGAYFDIRADTLMRLYREKQEKMENGNK